MKNDYNGQTTEMTIEKMDLYSDTMHQNGTLCKTSHACLKISSGQGGDKPIKLHSHEAPSIFVDRAPRPSRQWDM